MCDHSHASGTVSRRLTGDLEVRGNGNTNETLTPPSEMRVADTHDPSGDPGREEEGCGRRRNSFSSPYFRPEGRGIHQDQHGGRGNLLRCNRRRSLSYGFSPTCENLDRPNKQALPHNSLVLNENGDCLYSPDRPSR